MREGDGRGKMSVWGEADVGRVTHVRTVLRPRGGSNASPIDASDQPASWRAIALAWSREPRNPRRNTTSLSGSLFFATFL